MKLIKRLLVLWGIWRVFGPETPPPFKTGQKHIAKIPGRTVFVGEHEFFVREAGDPDNPPVVLIHGWGDHSLVVWPKVVTRLAETHHVYALDSRNTGKSDAIREHYDISDVADELAGVIGQLGFDGPVPLAGYSMGGFVVQSIVHRHPGVASRMVLAGTASCPVAGDPMTRAGFGVFTLLGRALDRVSKVEVSWLRAKYLANFDAVAPEHARYFWTEHMNRDAHMYWAAADAVSRFDSRAWVSKLGLPTLVIINTGDQLVPAKSQYQLASLIPGAEVVEVVGANHEAPLSEPHKYADAIVAFLAGA
jgi:3-oxoadipate enol-lactonase